MGANKSKHGKATDESGETTVKTATGDQQQQGGSRIKRKRTFTLRRKRQEKNESAPWNVREDDVNTSNVEMDMETVDQTGAGDVKIGGSSLKTDADKPGDERTDDEDADDDDGGMGPFAMNPNENDGANEGKQLPPRCDVCRQKKVITSQGILVTCSSCKISVHKECFISESLGRGDEWKCPPCKRGINPAELECYFCPEKGGALKPIAESNNGLWGHMACAFFIPEVLVFTSEDGYEEDTLGGVNEVPAKRWKRICGLCHGVTGITLPCQFQPENGKCEKAFHVSCALNNDLEMTRTFMKDETIEIMCLCEAHSHLDQMPQSRSSTHSHQDQMPQSLSSTQVASA